MAMNLEKTYASIIGKYPEFVNQKQFCEICGLSRKTAREYERKGLIKTTASCNPATSIYHERRFNLSEVFAFLYRRECREEPNSEFIVGMKKYYLGLFAKYPDLLTVKDIEGMTGFRSTAIASWINKHGLVGFKRGKMFLIPKTSLVDFVTSPYYRLIKNKTAFQKKVILEYERTFYGGGQNG